MPEREIFSGAIKLSGAARDAFIREACGGDEGLRQQVEALLQAHDLSQDLDFQLGSELPVPTRSIAPESVAGTVVVGRYKLLEPIGEGGMGTVWLAEQKEPVKRKVALKLIKAGMDSRTVLARFEAERQALAVMDHPHIAKVLDGGTTQQGHPYFVMELVKGIPLTRYCDQVQMAVSQRLEIFNQVCSAVQHAHQKGIIHRDLKPSNILVTEHDGKPMSKVIDFGLAKAIHGVQTLTDVSMHTAFGAVVGTPLYMAPEQLGVNALDIDTRADLYSLGVILYELLTGSTPIERQRLKKAALGEIMRIVREEEPAIPSQRLSSSETLPSVAARRHIEPARLTKLVRGDLDWIVMKTLEKDRNRRYETANGLSLDIQRYLAGEAVLAAPPSSIYRFRKFVRKHRVPVIAASLLALSLIGGIIGTSVGFNNARLSAKAESDAKLDAQNKQAEAERARGEAERERTVAELARNDALSQKTRAEAREEEAIDAVRRFGDSVASNRDLKNNPSLESLRKTLLQEPLAFFQSLRTRLQSDPGTTPESLARLAQAALNLGKLTDEIGDKQNAIIAYEHARAIYERLVHDNPTVTEYQSDLARSHNNIGFLLSATGKPAEALNAYEQSLEIGKRLASENPTVTKLQNDLASGHNNIGKLLAETGKPIDALKAYEQALQIFKRLASENPTVTEFQSNLATCHLNFGNLLSDTGKPAEALTAYEQSLEIGKRLASENPTVTEFQSAMAGSQNNIGKLLAEAGKPAEALKAFEQALQIYKRLTIDNPTVTGFQSRLARSHFSIGRMHGATGRPADALKAFEQALKVQKQLASENPTVTEFKSALAASHNDIGNLFSATGKPADAFKAYEQALEIQKRLANENPTMVGFLSDVGATLNNISVTALKSGKFVDARNSLRDAVEFQKRALATNVNHPTYRQFLKNHYTNLLLAADGLRDAELRLEARRGLAELEVSEPSQAKTEERIKAIVGGEKEKSSAELMTLGKRANETMRYALAVKLWGMAFERYPDLVEAHEMNYRLSASCAAVLAAAITGIDDPAPDDQAKIKLRKQALQWLQADLEVWKKLLESGDEKQEAEAKKTLKAWQDEPNLASVQGDAIDKLPENEQQAWRQLWKQVADAVDGVMPPP